MPQWAHVPLIMGPSGKLSKRDGAKYGFPVFAMNWTDPRNNEFTEGFKEKGFLPEAFINLLAVLGWNDGTEQELFSMHELIEKFSMERVHKAGAKFDFEKAKWFNNEWIKKLSVTGYGLRVKEYFETAGVNVTDQIYFDKVLELVKAYRFSASLEGSFNVGERVFDWDVGALYNQNKNVQASFGNLNLASVQRALGPSFMNGAGQVQCGTAENPLPFSSCVPWNPLLHYGQAGPGGLDNPVLRDFLFQREHSLAKTETTIYTANIAGDLLQLPGGKASFALGAEYRREEGEFVPDGLAVTGGSTNLAGRATRGSYSENSVYGELYLPLLTDVVAARELSLSLSSRYSDYDTFGETTNSKVGLPASEATKNAWANPNDKPLEDYSKK